MQLQEFIERLQKIEIEHPGIQVCLSTAADHLYPANSVCMASIETAEGERTDVVVLCSFTGDELLKSGDTHDTPVVDDRGLS